MTSGFPSGGPRGSSEFQPPYFPPPFHQQGGEMFGVAHHSQNINDPYTPSLHCFQTSQVLISNSVLSLLLSLLELIRPRVWLRAGEAGGAGGVRETRRQ